MAENKTGYPLELLKAVDNWQKGGDAAAKEKRGKRLKSLVPNYCDPLLLKCSTPVYRRLALDQSYIWIFIATGKLPETISAWIADIEVAKGFKGGVPDEWKGGKRWCGVIVKHIPQPHEVILHLANLGVDMKFQRSLEYFGRGNFAEGIERYKNSQQEVVLEIAEIHLNEIYSWGGRSSPIEDISSVLGDAAAPEQLAWLRGIPEDSDVTRGAPWWLTERGSRNVTQRVLEIAKDRGFPVPTAVRHRL